MIYAIVMMLVGAIVFMTMTLAGVLNDKRHNVIEEAHGLTLSYDSVDSIYYIYTETSTWVGMHDEQEAEQLFDTLVKMEQEG